MVQSGYNRQRVDFQKAAMSALPVSLPRLNSAAHDDLWDWAQTAYLADAAAWQPLFLNGLHLGHIDAKWRELIIRDWHGAYSQASDGLHLEADGWLGIGDGLQHMAFLWKQLGLLHGWRDERFDVRAPNGQVLFTLERAAFRPLGLQSHAVHLNGWTQQNGEWCVWIGRRSPHKAVDPDKLDNLVGGGIADGETPLQAVLRESEEEAGLNLAALAHAASGRLKSLRPVPRGLHNEILHLFDTVLPPHLTPENQDGEVASFTLMPPHEAVAAMLADQMMSDAQLVVLDAFLRFGALDPQHPLAAWLRGLACDEHGA